MFIVRRTTNILYIRDNKGFLSQNTFSFLREDDYTTVKDDSEARVRPGGDE